jgi:alpha-galactosidase
VRPSSGAATSELLRRPANPESAESLRDAAPEDGRTPSLTHYFRRRNVVANPAGNGELDICFSSREFGRPRRRGNWRRVWQNKARAAPVKMKTKFLLYSFLAFALLALGPGEAGAQTNGGNADSRVITIATAHSSLVLFTGADGRLYQLHYGGADQNAPAPRRAPGRDVEFFPQYGDGLGENFIPEPALQATHTDGNMSTDLIYSKHNTETVDANVRVTRIELKDPAYPFFVTLCLKSYHDEDMIEQWAEIRHDESGPVVLYRYASCAPLWQAKEYWLTQFHGDYAREAALTEEKLGPGLKALDSHIGVRATRYCLSSFILSLDGPASEETGEVVGGSLEWSGSFELAFEQDPKNHLRALCGINPLGEQYHLPRGEVFKTPAMLWTWSAGGKGQVSRNFHRWALRYGLRDGGKPRPVLLNNWEATGMKFDENLIVSLFDGAKEIGADTFLLDDGWFGNAHPRNQDNAGLGDWEANTNKLPRGLAQLAAEAGRRGVNFGIWIEPEMVNPSSDLFGEHPEWAMQEAHRKPDLSRNQLDLDLSRPAVRDFVWSVVDKTFGTPGVSYVKWDCNRFVTQPGSTYLPPEQQSDLLVDYNFALYDVMARMAKKYPRVMVMECSGGSGRADYGAMKYFDSFWPSDNTDPRDRVKIQWSFSHFFPAAALADHVTQMGNRPLKFALDVAMSGALGVDMDLRKLSSDQRTALASGIAVYKQKIRDVVEQGGLYRVESPYEKPRAALDFVSTDLSRAVLFVYQLEDAKAEPVKPRGLDPQRRYHIAELNLPAGAKSQLAEDGQTVDGATLMRDGLAPPCEKRFQSAVIELEGEK